MKKLKEDFIKDLLQKHPFLPNQKYPTKLLPTTIPRIYGKFPNDIPTWMHLSTNMITHAEFTLIPGKHFEPPDIHARLAWL